MSVEVMPSAGDGISVVPAKVQDVGKYVYSITEALRAALDSAEQDVASLTDDGWTGDAATEFAEGWSDLRDGGIKILDALTGLAEKLGITAANYGSQDQDRAAVIDSSTSSLDLP